MHSMLLRGMMQSKNMMKRHNLSNQNYSLIKSLSMRQEMMYTFIEMQEQRRKDIT